MFPALLAPILAAHLALDLTVPGGPPDCPDEAHLRAAVAARLSAAERPGVVVAAPATEAEPSVRDDEAPRFTVRFEATPAGRRATIEGNGLWRILDVPGPNCPVLADAVAFSLALAVAPVPEALEPLVASGALIAKVSRAETLKPVEPGADPAPDPEADPEPEPAPGNEAEPEPLQALETHTKPASVDRNPPAPTFKGLAIVPTFAVAMGAGAAPAPAVEYRPGLELRLGRVRIAADVLIQPPRSTSTAGGGAEIARYGGSLRTCLAPLDPVTLCGVATGAWWRARGTGFAFNERVDTLYLATGARVAGRILRWNGLEVSAYAEGLVHPGRFTLQADGAEVFASSRWGVLGGLALGWRFQWPQAAPANAAGDFKTDFALRPQTGG